MSLGKSKQARHGINKKRDLTMRQRDIYIDILPQSITDQCVGEQLEKLQRLLITGDDATFRGN